MKKMTKAMLMTALICGTMYCGAEPVHANELDTFALDEYVVTATRTPVKLFDANANISVVTRADIENEHLDSLEEALRTVQGVEVLNYGNRGMSGSSVRINGALNVVMLIDGVRANHAGVPLHAAFLDLENVESIEVLKGAASALYGADAKGGVINIITRKPDGNKTTVSIAGGNFSTEHYKLHNEGKEKSWSYSIDVAKELQGDYEDGDGNKWESKYYSENINLKVRKDLGEGSDLTVGYDYHKYDYKYENKFSLPCYVYGDTENKAFYTTWNQKINDTTTNTLAIRKGEYDNRYDAVDIYGTGLPYIKVEHYKTLSISDYITKQFGDTHTVTLGVDYVKDEDVEANKNIYSTMYNRAVYLQDEWNFDKRWKLTSGIRYDKNSWAGSNTTPRFNLGYKFNEDTNMYVSYSEFFVPPAVSKYTDPLYGNMNLVAEEGENYEIGINHKFDDTSSMTAHYFERSTNNKLGYLKDYPWTNVNIDKEDTKGFDIQFSKVINNNLSLFTGYTYLKLEDSSAGVNQDGHLPRHAINIGVDYNLNKFDLAVNAKVALERGKDQPQGVFPDNNYVIVDVAANYKATDNIKLFAKVNNLFDKFYAEHTNCLPGWGGNPGDWYAMPGRTILVGMEYSF